MGVRTYIYLPEPSDLHALAFLAGSVPPPLSALAVAMPPPSTASSSTSGAVGGALLPPSSPSVPGASTATATEPKHGKGSKSLSQLLAEIPLAGGASLPPSSPSVPGASTATATEPKYGRGSKPLSRLLAEMPVASLVVAGASPRRVAPRARPLAGAPPLSGVSLLALAAEALAPPPSLAGVPRS